MNDRPKGTIFAKQQIEIKGYIPDKLYGQDGKTLDSLSGINLSVEEGDTGRPNNYAIFKEELKTFLRKKPAGERVLCDIEERESKNPEYGPSRTIVQVYDNSEPVLKGKGQKSFGKSPETIRLEHELDMELEAVRRVSIERQTAANIAFEHCDCLMPTQDMPTYLGMAETIFQWLHTGKLPGVTSTLKTASGTVKPSASQPEGKATGCGVDTEFIRELYPKLNWSSDGTAISYITNTFKVKRMPTLEETINLLTPEQKKTFVDYVSKRAAG